MKPQQRKIEYGVALDLDEARLACYVCETDLSESGMNGKGERKNKESRKHIKDKDRDKLKPGLVELSTQGTGFAGGGKNLVGKEGIAFQC